MYKNDEQNRLLSTRNKALIKPTLLSKYHKPIYSSLEARIHELNNDILQIYFIINIS